MNYRYEPTRYVIVASHHDSWHKGAARPGIGHAVLMELVRTLGYEAKHGWKPGLHLHTDIFKSNRTVALFQKGVAHSRSTTTPLQFWFQTDEGLSFPMMYF